MPRVTRSSGPRGVHTYYACTAPGTLPMFREFVALSASFVTVVGPFLPALSRLLGAL